MKLFIIDDEEQVQKVLKIKLEREKFDVQPFYNVDDWMAVAEKGDRAPVLICDIRMPGKDGFWLLKRARELDPLVKVIMITGHGEKQMAIQALRLGAADYLEKPFDLDELVLAIRRCEKEWLVENERNELMKRLEVRAERSEKPKTGGEFVSKSKSMQEVQKWLKVLKREADRTATAEEPSVLILGDTGTGKEVLARAIYQDSRRVKGPWIVINCANFSPELLESELFGHEKGAFSGASNLKLGLFELADKGTLFLDEIGEMPASLQAKLLRVLQEKTFRRVGGTHEIKVDVRVLAATHVHLEEQVKDKKFREDLYHRLAKVIIKLPRLKERNDEFSDLIEFFFKRSFDLRGKIFTGFDEDAWLALQAYEWPGNIRELINLSERSSLLSEDKEKVRLEWLGIPKASKEIKASAEVKIGEKAFAELRDQFLSQFELGYLQTLLRECQGNVTQAAKRAKMDRSNLNKLIKRYKLAVK